MYMSMAGCISHSEHTLWQKKVLNKSLVQLHYTNEPTTFHYELCLLTAICKFHRTHWNLISGCNGQRLTWSKGMKKVQTTPTWTFKTSMTHEQLNYKQPNTHTQQLKLALSWPVNYEPQSHRFLFHLICSVLSFLWLGPRPYRPPLQNI